MRQDNQTFYDVFNGDADGICALHQLRLSEPRPEARLISGVKRDINLLKQINNTENSVITVLDISLENNREALAALLDNNCSVLYVDHHFAGLIPDHPALEAHIDPEAETCTSLIVDRLLGGKHSLWAVAAAFGDNLHDIAIEVATSLAIPSDKIDQLRELGELLNYNSYGLTIDDLHFPPLALYEAIKPFADPFEFYNRSDILAELREGYVNDLAKAASIRPDHESSSGRIYRLPAEPWARRVAGVFSNAKARQEPDLAHALLIENPGGTLRISVRAPLTKKTGADTLCLSFPTGGGRAAAAGINALPREQLSDFLLSFNEVFKR